jgi:hypothetical protein
MCLAAGSLPDWRSHEMSDAMRHQPESDSRGCRRLLQAIQGEVDLQERLLLRVEGQFEEVP